MKDQALDYQQTCLDFSADTEQEVEQKDLLKKVETAINPSHQEGKKPAAILHEDASNIIEYFFTKKGEEQFSHQLLFYDRIPKYIPGIAERDMGKRGRYLPIAYRHIKIEDRFFNVAVHPVRQIKTNKKTKQVEEVDFYPSTREQLVEDALRKMAADHRGRLLRNLDKGCYNLVVEFTLNELQSMLKRSGKTLSYTELKDAIDILAKASIEVSCETDHPEFKSGKWTFSIINNMSWAERRDGDRAGNLCRIEFNRNITNGILNGDIRLFNYERSMSLRSPLARWLYKRLAAKFTYACNESDFNLKLKTIFDESGERRYKQMSKNLRRVEQALAELIEKDVISHYDEQRVFSNYYTQKIIDCKYLLYPSQVFINECFIANKRRSETKTSVIDRGFRE